MLNELYLYAELLFFLAGTLLYGFLARALWRRRDVLVGNWPLRALMLSVMVWYGGTLIDQLIFLLFGSPATWQRAGVVLDIVRSFAWLLSFPLFVHALERMLAEIAPDAHRDSRLRFLPWFAYLTLGLFLEPIHEFFVAGSPMLVQVLDSLKLLILAHGTWNLGLCGILLARLLRHLENRRIVSFLRILSGIVLWLFALQVVGTFFDPWGEEARGIDRLLRTLLLGGMLLPGGLFAFYVQHYNLLRLSLSHRSLRHFAAVLVLVVAVMAAGPAIGVADTAVFRRVVAWGLLLALFGGTVYSPLVEAALARFPALRRLLGRNLSPQELDRLMDSVQDPGLDEAEARRRTADAVGRWLGCRAELAIRDELPAALGPIWRFFETDPRAMIHRLNPPSPELAASLAKRRLHAAFALRIGGELEGVLGVSSDATGGGYADGELEAIRLVMRQLAATLALRRMLDTRLAEERRAQEYERLGMLGLISASLAHEIKNPLSSMKALAQALREDLAARDPDDDGVTDLDLIVEQIDRLHRTTREILGVARPRPGERADLTALVRSVLYILGAEARKRGVELVGESIEDVGRMAGSAAAWQTVVFNLVLNAVEHTPAGETVFVRLRRLEGDTAQTFDGEDIAADGANGGEGIIFETDNPGEPLDIETQRRIFDPFVSHAPAVAVDDPTDHGPTDHSPTGHGGTGLGLALVSRRLEDLGGTIDVHCAGGRVHFYVEVGRAEGRDHSVR